MTAENNTPQTRSNPIWKWTKRLLKIFGVLFLLLIIAAIAIPYFFKDQILNKVKEYINTQTTATVDFKDVHLSLLWTFPEFTFQMDSFSVTGKEEFEGLKLADMQKLRLGIDLWSVFSGNYKITSVSLDNANFYVKVLNNGKANYDIMKPDTSATTTPDQPASEPTQFSLKLDYYELNNVNVTYDDAPSKTYVAVRNLVHSGSGDFTADNFNLYTKTKIDSLTFSSNRVKYLNKAKIDIVFNAQIDNANKKYTLLDNSFKINALELNAEGDIAMPNDKDIALNLKFNAPTTGFNSVLSMIPAAFTKDFDGVKTSGTFALNGQVNGTYNERSMPAFSVNLSVDNADFQYPSLPMGIKDIHTKIAVNSPSSDLDKMTIDISKFHFLLGANPFDLVLKLRTPMSDPDIDTKITGKINFEELAKAFPMDAKLTGSMDANLEAKTRLSYIETQQYDKVVMNGLLAILGMRYEAAGSVPTVINEMRMSFTPNNVQLQNFDLRMGKSDIRAHGTLDNILTYFSREKVMKGNLVVTSNVLDLNELAGGDSPADEDPKAATNMVDTTSAPATDKPFDQFEFAMDATLNKILYDVYEIKGFKAKGSFAPSLAKLENLELLIGKVDLKASGSMENVFGYVFDNTLLKGVLNIHSNYLNLNQFMTESGQATEPEPQPVPADPATAKSETQPLIIPANLDFALNGTFTKFIYDTYKLQNVRATMRVYQQKVEISELSADALGGKLALNGEYNSQNAAKPSFKIGYDLQNLDIQQVAKTVGVAQYFLPILKSFYGKFNSNLKVNGFLDQNMYPDLKSLTAEGMLKTFDAVLRNFTPAKKLWNQLKMGDMNEVALKNTTNFLKLKDGRVTFDRFADEFKGIGFTIEGSHGLDNTLDYDLTLRIPRKLLESNPIGAVAGQAANTGIQLFNNEAQKLGIQLQQSDFINVGVDILGSMSDPQYKVRLLGAEKGGQSMGNQIVNNAKEELDRLKAEAEAKAKAEAERLKNEAEARARAEAERLRAEAEAKAKAEADRLRAEAERLKAEAANKAKAEADRLRAQAEAKAKEAARLQAVQDSIKKAMQNKSPFGNPFGGGKNN